jgi:chromosome segregation ATPase
METSLADTIKSLEEYLAMKLEKLEHFNTYKKEIELHLSQTQTTIDECEEEIRGTKSFIRILNT